MLPINDLTPEEVREMFDYDPSTGVLSWKRPSGRWGRIKAGTPAGCPCTTGHLQVGIRGRYVMAHRLAFMHFHGCVPQGCVDHINGIKQDNRIENLRDVSKAVNNQNIKRANSLSNHGRLGISRNGVHWKAAISVNGKQRHLGTFKTPEEAQAVYLEAKRRLHPGCTI